jgi:hypothetical protein
MLDVEQEIQKKGLNAPRITPDDIEATILAEQYEVFAGTSLTVCVLTLQNGFNVTGESACASPENYDAELVRQIARRNALSKIWALEGYLLIDKLRNSVARIAKTCHEVNAAYCLSLGDNSQPSWADAPDWQKKSAITGVNFHLSNPNAGPAASHESWLAEKEADGWVYGPVKDVEAKEHPCFVPYKELPAAQQLKDALFIAVVKSFG